MLSFKTIEGLGAKATTDTIAQIYLLERLLHDHGAWTKQAIEDALDQDSNHGVFIQKNFNTEDNPIICYCLYQHLFEVAEILRIGTHPNYQRQGLAKKLIETVVKDLSIKEVDRLLLEVARDNHSAIELYQKLGFEIISTRKAYYQRPHHQPVDALIMQYKF